MDMFPVTFKGRLADPFKVPPLITIVFTVKELNAFRVPPLMVRLFKVNEFDPLAFRVTPEPITSVPVFVTATFPVTVVLVGFPVVG